MEDRFEIITLLDCYGCLLTEKQQDIMSMYYYDDFSLAEIAEINNTSRQAIHDLIKRCYKILLSYEEKLGLKQKLLYRKKMKYKLVELLKESGIDDREKMNKFELIIDDMINA